MIYLIREYNQSHNQVKMDMRIIGVCEEIFIIIHYYNLNKMFLSMQN